MLMTMLEIRVVAEISTGLDNSFPDEKLKLIEPVPSFFHNASRVQEVVLEH